ncbi:hybrid sensor histidine kinase/response regulator [Novosphingobium sp.]|uniref:hybrid sensor histidine kinase/response regulator n=1 Tax=Novosphingobium sp. TaxID=1874826 RepID=UPI0031E0884B
MGAHDLSQFSMRDLFRMEAGELTQSLTAALLELERTPTRPDLLEDCMRAAHSLKGAARIVDLRAAVTVAHAMEDLFVAAQKGEQHLDRARIDLLLGGVDLLSALARAPDEESAPEQAAWQADADRFATGLADHIAHAPVAAPPVAAPIAVPVAEDPHDRSLRVSAENLNRMLDLAGETLVETHQLRPFEQSLLRLKRMQREAAVSLDTLEAALPPDLDDRARAALSKLHEQLAACRQHLGDRLSHLESRNHRSSDLAHRLYHQALRVRMRPLADGLGGFPRMVRDIAHELGKQVRLEISGERTQVDRDILERLEAPLGHVLRNALDHGLESPPERLAAGKLPEGVIRLSAGHHAGALQVVVEDDGRGIDLDKLRATVIARGLSSEETAAKLSESELLEFLFLPGFTMKEGVTQLSGRGVGLDVVQEMIRQVRGLVRITAKPGEGTRFKLELPLTLSVVRSLLVSIGGEPYAFPFAHIARAMKVPLASVKVMEGRQYLDLDGQAVGLVTAHQVLGCAPASVDDAGQDLSVVLLGTPGQLYGVVVDRFVGGAELVVRPLDPRLGKIKDIGAAALTEDGAPLLIVDVDDMLRSLEKLSASDRLGAVGGQAHVQGASQRKRVLVVDDSFTVRELERKLLDHHGYAVEVAVDGMDGWNMLKGGHFDLVISDIDMPRMDGIELVRRIRADAALHAMPVMILSYKDREEDRQRGLEVGADYYLTKGSFQNNALIDAVVDLIGEAVV